MDGGARSYRRFLQGDDGGIVEIIRDYKDGLTLYLTGYVGNVFVAEELMEDVFFKLVTKKPRFSGKCSFKTWLYTIGRNTALDYLRHSARAPSVPFENVEQSLAEQAQVESVYIKEEEKIALHRALAKLQPNYRQVLYLLYFEDLSYKEAAHIMKKNIRQIENLTHRAKNSLKAILEKEGVTV